MSQHGKLRFIGAVEKAGEQEATVRVFQEFCAGLKGLEAFSYVIILYRVHLCDNEIERQTLLVFAKRQKVKVQRGVFASRSPSRLNPIGLFTLKLLRVEGCRLTVEGLDALKNSPIIDIKPYLPRADSVPEARVIQWTQNGPSS
jgi:tRNA-Thr(GGU) m(6)t(6)A37 methyltransferase TsaA